MPEKYRSNGCGRKKVRGANMSNPLSRGKNVLVGTIPRSGTNLIYYFNIFYEIFLSDETLTPQNIFTQIDLHLMLDKFEKGYRRRTALNIDHFFVGHAYCPGFIEYGKSFYKEAWERLHYDEDWWNALGASLVAHKEAFYPQLNKNAAIVFLYRNPLDTMVSLYRHLEHHRNKPGNISDFDGFCKAYIPCYIKTYLSYIESYKEYPENILLIKYENLMGDTSKVLKLILNFINRPVTEKERVAFDNALEVTKPDEMRKLERYLGRTLANDQNLPPGLESHLRGGEIGKWRKSFSQEQILIFDQLFGKFSISLKELIGQS